MCAAGCGSSERPRQVEASATQRLRAPSRTTVPETEAGAHPHKPGPLFRPSTRYENPGHGLRRRRRPSTVAGSRAPAATSPSSPRGAHLAAMREPGLTIENEAAGRHSPAAREARPRIPRPPGTVDLVLISVKLWDIEAAARAVRPAVGAQTARPVAAERRDEGRRAAARVRRGRP